MPDMFEEANKKTTSKEKTIKPEIKPIDKEDFKQKILTVVAYMESVADTNESIKSILKDLKDKYGIKATVSRAVATVIFKQNIEDVEEKHNTIKDLLDQVL